MTTPHKRMTASEYMHSLPKTPQLLGKRAFHVRDPADQLADKAAAGGEMEKCLNWFHVAMLGTGECGDTQQETPVMAQQH